MPIRLLHTSDWHLGRQLHGVSLLQDQAHVLDQIVGIAEREAVDAVLIAGDVYDRAIPPADAVELLGKTLDRLCRELGKTVLLIAGNHDSGERLGFGAGLMGAAGLHIVGPLGGDVEPVLLETGSGALELFGLPYAGPLRVREVLAEEVASHGQAMAALLRRVEQRRNKARPAVVVAHCFVAGGEESDSERPLSVGGADQVPASLFAAYSYAALGHLHRPQSREHEHIRYSGSLLKYSFSEASHRKSVTLVDIDAAGGASWRAVPLEPLRDLRIVEGTLEQILAQGRTDPGAQDYVLARITDRQAVLDVMGKLRSVYPNVLQMQHIGLRESGPDPEAGRDMLRKSYLELFEEFFEDVQDEPLSEAQRACLAGILDGLDGGGA